MRENEISRQILDAAIAVHKELGGPGEFQFLWELSTTFQDSFGSRLPLRAEP